MNESDPELRLAAARDLEEEGQGSTGKQAAAPNECPACIGVLRRRGASVEAMRERRRRCGLCMGMGVAPVANGKEEDAWLHECADILTLHVLTEAHGIEHALTLMAGGDAELLAMGMHPAAAQAMAIVASAAGKAEHARRVRDAGRTRRD